MAVYIGIDIGGTHIRAAHSDSVEYPKLRDKIQFPTSVDFVSDLSGLTEYISTRTPISGIGISLPGRLNSEKNLVIGENENTRNYKDKPLVQILEERFNCGVQMENDTVAASLAEAYLKNRNDNFIYIVWGTGIGGAEVKFINQRPQSTNLEREDFLTYWEDLLGGKRLEERFGDSPERFSEETWKQIFTALEDAILVSKDNLLTNKIIFGGGISIKQKGRLQALAGKLSSEFPDLPKIEVSELGEDAGILGALQLLR